MSVTGHHPKDFKTRRSRRKKFRADQFREVFDLWEKYTENKFSRWTQESKVWMELPKPIRWGWYRYWVIRPDVAKSPEARVLQKILPLIQNIEQSTRKDFSRRDYQRGRKFYPVAHRQRGLHEDEWKKLDPSLQRRFVLWLERRKNYGRGVTIYRWYILAKPWQFESRTKPYYMTHVEVKNGDLESQRKFFSNKLWDPGRKDWPYRHLLRRTGDSMSEWDDDIPDPQTLRMLVETQEGVKEANDE